MRAFLTWFPKKISHYRAGSFFENLKLTIQEILFVAADWVENPGKPIRDVVAQLGISTQTIVDLHENFRRMTEQWFIRESQRHLKLGGPGTFCF